ncbi:MAG: hypothetical protein ABW221_23690 [Vicinamibacteria bacterium]
MRIRTAIFTGVTGLMLNLGLGQVASAQSDYRYNDRYDDRQRYDDRDRYDRSDSRRGRSSREYRAEEIVRQAYRDILRREADRSGLRQYTNSMLRDGWSQADVRRSLQRSDEYRDKFGRGRRSYRR